jgi:hypothetical protein
MTSRRGWLEVAEVPHEAKAYDGFVKWLRAEAERFDFALAPLRDTPFNGMKSSLKLLEYGGLGLPIVASDVAVYRVGGPGVRLVENRTTNWIRALSEQIALGEQNRVLGSELRGWVLGSHMLRDSLPEFDRMVLGMVERGDGAADVTERRTARGRPA